LTPGRIVHYRLKPEDCTTINARRGGGGLHGNPAVPGATVPAIVVVAWGVAADGTQSFNGQAILDGNDTLWLTSVPPGTGPGTWSWPPRV